MEEEYQALILKKKRVLNLIKVAKLFDDRRAVSTLRTVLDDIQFSIDAIEMMMA